MKKLLTVLFILVMLVCVLTVTAFADDSALVVDGQSFTENQLESNLSGSGWRWNAAGKELTLSNYLGGAIWAKDQLTVVLADKTDNRIQIASSEKMEEILFMEDLESGEKYTIPVALASEDHIILKGSGSLSIDVPEGIFPNDEEVSMYASGIAAPGGVVVDMEGKLSITGFCVGIFSTGEEIKTSGSGDIVIDTSFMGILLLKLDNALHPLASGITLSGTGDITITSLECITADYGVAITGSGNVTLNPKDDGYGICCERDDVKILGSGNVTVNGTAIKTNDNGDKITGKVGIVGKNVLINGSGSVTINIAGDEACIGIRSFHGNIYMGGSRNITVRVTADASTGIRAYGEAVGSGAVEVSGKANLTVIASGAETEAANISNTFAILGEGTVDLTSITDAIHFSGDYQAGTGEVQIDGNSDVHIRTTVGSGIRANVVRIGNADVEIHAGADGIHTSGGYSLSGEELSGKVMISGEVTINAGDTGINGKAAFSGSGKVTINAGNMGINGNAAFSGSGKVTINAGNTGINGNAAFSGSGNVTVAGEQYGIVVPEDNQSDIFDVLISGSGSVTVDGYYAGIQLLKKEKDLILSGSGSVTIQAEEGSAVSLQGGCVYLNGTGAPVCFKTQSGIKPAVSSSGHSDPSKLVKGSGLPFYGKVTGAPTQSIVIYDEFDDLLIDGDYYPSAADNAGDGWTWSAAGQTLTLDGYDGGRIRALRPLDVVLADGTNNKITIPEGYLFDGIYVAGDCSVTGTGSLEIENAEEMCGICAEGDLSVNMGGRLEISSGYECVYCAGNAKIAVQGGLDMMSSDGAGICAAGDLEISAGGRMAVYARTEGIYSAYGSVSLSGADIAVDACTCGIRTYEKGIVAIDTNGRVRVSQTGYYGAGQYGGIIADSVNITGKGEVLVTAEDYNGIETENCLTVSGTDLTVTAGNIGIVAQGGVKFSGSDVTVSSGSAGMLVYNTEISGGKVHIDAGDRGIWYYGDAVITGSDLTVIAGAEGIATDYEGTLKISGSNTDITSEKDGMLVETVEISGKGDLTITAAKGNGIYASGDIAVGGGTVTVSALEESGIYSHGGNVAVSASSLTVTAQESLSEYGIYAGKNVTLSGGDAKVTAGNAIYSDNGTVTISGKGDVTILAASNGIDSFGDVILSGSGSLSIKSTRNAVSMYKSGSALYLNGTGSPLSFVSNNGKAVTCLNGSGPVIAGTNIAMYDKVTGAPEEYILVYDMSVPVSREPEVQNFTKETGTAFAAVSFEDGGKTAVVSCSKACVVLAKTGEGEYTVLKATERSKGTCYTYDLRGIAGDFELVIALRADANMDGTLNSADLSQARAIAKGKLSADALKFAIIDVRPDGVYNSADLSQIRAMFKGKIDIAW